jgi:hypothetical protein
MRILVLQANSDSDNVLQLNREVRQIKRTFSNTISWDVEIVQEGAVQARDLQELFMRHKPEIVHFSGHGTDRGELMLETNEDTSEPVSVKALGGIFSSLGENVCCVMLNACYSSRQANAIAKWVPYVIGMSSRITDDASIAFSTSFYQALAFGKHIDQAFCIGKHQLELEYRGESRIPTVHCLASRRARKHANSLQPAIQAKFELDETGKPEVNDNDEYQLTIFITRHPRSAHCCVYQYIDEWGNTIKKKHQFDVVPNDRKGFESEASLYGNVLIRASLWSTEGGLSLQSYLVDALHRYYHGRMSTSIVKALKDVATN